MHIYIEIIIEFENLQCDVSAKNFEIGSPAIYFAFNVSSSVFFFFLFVGWAVRQFGPICNVILSLRWSYAPASPRTGPKRHGHKFSRHVSSFALANCQTNFDRMCWKDLSLSLEQAHNLFDHAFPDAFLAMFSTPSSSTLFHLTEAHELPRQAKRSIYRLIKPEPRRDHHHRWCAITHTTRPWCPIKRRRRRRRVALLNWFPGC